MGGAREGRFDLYWQRTLPCARVNLIRFQGFFSPVCVADRPAGTSGESGFDQPGWQGAFRGPDLSGTPSDQTRC